MKNKLPYCGYFSRLSAKLVTFEDKIASFFCSGIVYKVQCGDCNATYYGKTKRQCVLLKRILFFYSAIMHQILKISQLSLSTTTTLMLP